MAHKKGAGSSRNGRDSKAKRLGVKRYNGELVISGNIIIRQRGNQFWPGPGTDMGKDFTIFATQEGFVSFEYIRRGRRQIAVRPYRPEEAARAAAAQAAAPAEA